MTEDIKLSVDLDQFELDDLEILDMSKSGGVTMREYLDVLDRLVVGGVRGKGYKGTQLKALAEAINEAVKREVNPEAGGKN